MPKGTLTSFEGPFPRGHTALNSPKNELAVASRATDHVLSDIINPGTTTSRSESLSFRLCYSKPMPPRYTLQFITHFGSIPPGKSYGKNIEINKQNKKRLWPKIDLRFTNSCSFNFYLEYWFLSSYDRLSWPVYRISNRLFCIVGGNEFHIYKSPDLAFSFPLRRDYTLTTTTEKYEKIFDDSKTCLIDHRLFSSTAIPVLCFLLTG